MIEKVIINIQETDLPYVPVLFKNLKRSFQILRRIFIQYPPWKTFTCNTVKKMMSSKKRASSKEIEEWLGMLERSGLCEGEDACSLHKEYRTTFYGVNRLNHWFPDWELLKIFKLEITC